MPRSTAGSTVTPRLSTKNIRSPSPSVAMPRSAFSATTRFFKSTTFLSCKGSGWWAGKLPSNSKFILTSSIWGKRLNNSSKYNAPMELAASATILNLLILVILENCVSNFTCSASAPSFSSISPVLAIGAKLPCSTSAINSSIPVPWPNGKPRSRTIFTPLYSLGLCEAEISSPPL